MRELIQIPLLRDNYAWLVAAEGRAFVVDPAEAEPVLALVQELGVELCAVLSTHHHADHVGGNLALVDATGCEVIGPAHDRYRIPGYTRGAAPGSVVEVAGMALRVLDVHAHTHGHVAFALDEPAARVVRHGHGGEPVVVERLAGKPALFVGDALFLAGCGRLFEGTAVDLFSALSTLAREDPSALVCCGHEYTEQNLAFALDALPDDAAVRQRQRELAAERGASKSSVPDELARELATNPFLRCLDESGRRALAARYGRDERADAVSVLAAVRRAKDAHT